MKTKDFNKLDPITQMSLITAMYVRNEMETFHCRHLSDEQMKELNPIIRQAIYNMLRYVNIATYSKNIDETITAADVIEFQVHSIPDYWELPSEEAFRKDMSSFYSPEGIR